VRGAAAAWINKPEEMPRTEIPEVQNSLITDIEQKNELIRSPITNDRPLVRDMGRAENQPSEDLVQ
jgi:hypothetical protein